MIQEKIHFERLLDPKFDDYKGRTKVIASTHARSYLLKLAREIEVDSLDHRRVFCYVWSLLGTIGVRILVTLAHI